MRGRGLTAWALGCLATACHSALVMEVPEFTPTPTSVLVIIEDADQLQLRAFTLEGASFPLVVARPSSAITILTYQRPLSVMQLAPGPVPLVAEDEPGARPLPIPAQIWTSDPDTDSVRSFKEVGLSERFAKLRIAGVDPRECLDNGWCLSEVDGQILCDQACQPNLPIAPAPPEAPQLYAQCPSGAVARTLRGGQVLLCDPPPRVASCDPGTRQGIWDPGCVPAGARCPAGPYATSLPTRRRLIYVDPQAAPGGDGSLAAPHDQLGAALTTALPDGVVVLAKGRHLATVSLPELARIDLLGACSAETIIEAPAGDPGMIWRGQGELRDLTLRGPTRALRISGAEASATLRHVLIEAGAEGGVVVDGQARMVAEDLRIRDLRPAVTTDAELLAVLNSTVAADGLFLEMGTDGYQADAREGREGLEVIQGIAKVRDLVIVGGLRGVGASQSQVVLEEVLIERAKKEAHRSSGGEVALRHLVVRDVGIEGLAGDATGLDLNSGAVGILERVSFHQVYNRAIRFDAATVTVKDVVIEGTPALYCNTSATVGRVLAERLHGEQPGKYGIYLNPGCEVEAHDVWMRGFRHAQEDGNATYTRGAKLGGRRWYLEEGTGEGVMAFPESALEFEDLELRGFRVGIGLFATGSSLTLRRAKISESRAVGVCLAPDGRARIEDLVVERTGLPTTEDGACPAQQSAGGAGLLVSANLDAQVLRFELRDNQNTGLLVFDGGFSGQDGTIHGNGIGVRSTTRFRLAEQLQRVRLYDNQGNLALED